jgi:hypothetical protein
MWKPKVWQSRERGCWHMTGVKACFTSWREAYAEACRAAVRFAGREAAC